MALKRFSRTQVLVAALLTFAVGSAAWAQSAYPNRPVRIMLAYGAGGVADVTTRIIAQKLGESTGGNFVIENRPGAGSIVAAKTALAAPHDGYTLFLSGNGTTISKSLFKTLPYDIETDFVPVAQFAGFDMLLATKADSKFNTVAKLVEYGKANPDKLNFGSVAVGSTQHLSAVLFTMVTGVNASLVTFRTTPELISAILRGDVDVGFDYYAAMRSVLDGTQLKIIATSGDHPSPILPGVPTMKDSGYPEFVVTSWNALSAPTGTPNDIVQKLNAEVNAVLKMPDVQARMAEFGIEPLMGTPEDQTARMKADIAKWRTVIDKAGIPKQ